MASWLVFPPRSGFVQPVRCSAPLGKSDGLRNLSATVAADRAFPAAVAGRSPMAKRRPSLSRYSAALLFQYRVVTDGVSNRRRTCEKRIIHFQASDGRAALRHAKKRGRQAEHKWKNKDGGQVFFEFVGVRDLIGCDPACEPDEVWYQVVEMITPMERRGMLIPPESELCAIRNNE